MVRTKDDIPPQDPKQNKRKGKPCKLAIGSIENIVAHGTVYERIEHNEAIHTVPLGESNVRVSVKVVIQKDAPLPIPIPDEMLIVGEAVGFFVAWPKNLVLVSDEGASINVECGKYQESIQSFVSLVEHIKYDEAIDIPLEKDIFGEEINVQLQKVDMEYICHVKELSVTCIMLYISHLHQVLKASNWRKQFVFVNPCVVSGKTMAEEKSKSVLLARRLEDAMLEQLVLIPYNIGYHWILLVIDLTLMIVYLLDPINSKINTSSEIVINTALKIYETTQKKRRTNPVWKVVQFNGKKLTRKPNLIKCELNKWILGSYLIVNFRRSFSDTMIFPQDFYKRYSLVSENLIIAVKDLHRLLFIREIWLNFQVLLINDMF
ncbi:uncharacterized protein LOC114298098 [Camellia sinensis]|uniref:uncharacterized protein LOC114298098 n=1 Tax=Camellia sinensis TaxID=4442 RepID=UPI0010358633|nr:uncharacterized protein LOC114298098 [Camellia sinensis]